jgi:hypothetical protein
MVRVTALWLAETPGQTHASIEASSIKHEPFFCCT